MKAAPGGAQRGWSLKNMGSSQVEGQEALSAAEQLGPDLESPHSETRRAAAREPVGAEWPGTGGRRRGDSGAGSSVPWPLLCHYRPLGRKIERTARQFSAGEKVPKPQITAVRGPSKISPPGQYLTRT